MQSPEDYLPSSKSLRQTGSRNSASAPQESPAVPEQAMRKLWEKMVSCFGHLWISSYGVDASGETGKTWAQGLYGINPTQMRKGVSAAIASDKPYPPTLPQFRSMCFGTDPKVIREPTKDEIAAEATRAEEADREYFTERNREWRADGHSADIFDIPRCIYTREKYLKFAEKKLKA